MQEYAKIEKKKSYYKNMARLMKADLADLKKEIE
jgi:hypothetical protein